MFIKVSRDYINSKYQYSCNLTYSEVEELILQNPFVYVRIYDTYSHRFPYDYGIFLFSRYSYPDDDQLVFVSPSGDSVIFSSLGTVTHYDG